MLSPVDQIKDRLSISDVVSSYLKLEKAGSNFKARCPFHNEKTPSFFVSPSRNSYHCFGCNKGGDIFTFVEDIEGVNFAEALKTLAERAGVQLTLGASKENLENKKSYALLDTAAKFFELNLLKNEEVKNYLKGRGLNGETVRSFRVGLAMDGWSNLKDYLSSKGFDERLMAENGLIIKGQKGYYDRFRGRIMFPLSDSQGRVVAFTGRIWEASLPNVSGSEASKQEVKASSAKATEAKYVNSPETALYNKSRILYGYDKAKRKMMQENVCIIVEGQMDLLMAHQAGMTNSVAVSGTAFTDEHIRLIKRFTETILLAFDADSAGLKASERGVGLALASGMDVKMVKLPSGFDPADIILKDVKVWETALKSAKHIVDFLLDHLEEKKTDERSFKLEVSKHVLPYVADIANKIDQAHFIKKVAERLSVSEGDIKAEVEKLIKSQGESLKKFPKDSPLSEQLPPKTLRQHIIDKILGIHLWKPDIVEAKRGFESIMGARIDEEVTKLSPAEMNDLIFQAEMYYTEDKSLVRELEELLDNLEKEKLEERLSGLMNDLRKAEEKKDEKETGEIMKKCHEVSMRINEIKNSRFLEK